MTFCRWIGVLALALSPLPAALAPQPAQAETPARDAMQEYVDFATYDAGIIRPEQITQDIFDSVIFIDTRTSDEFTTGTIPGAQHIEWRSVFERMEDIPENGKVILFCNTGALSAQAAFGLRVLGRENVLVLQTGYHGWLENAAFRP